MPRGEHANVICELLALHFEPKSCASFACSSLQQHTVGLVDVSYFPANMHVVISQPHVQPRFSPGPTGSVLRHTLQPGQQGPPVCKQGFSVFLSPYKAQIN